MVQSSFRFSPFIENILTKQQKTAHNTAHHFSTRPLLLSLSFTIQVPPILAVEQAGTTLTNFNAGSSLTANDKRPTKGHYLCVTMFGISRQSYYHHHQSTLWLFLFFFGALRLQFHLSSAESIPYPPLSAPNNVIKLIIKTYVHELLDNPRLDSNQLKTKLTSMNDYISTHPALHQRYLWVGPTPPADFNPDLHEINFDRNTTRYVMTNKRKRSSSNIGIGSSSIIQSGSGAGDKEQLPSEEICETKQKWEQINETHDLYDNKAVVIQQEDMKQFVFSYRCAKNKGKCLGISPLFESECTERSGWMYMYYKPENKPAQWGFVNAPHHCACRLKPKFYQPTIASDEPTK